MTNRITWITLISLTIMGFAFSESSFLGPSLAISILLLYGIKFLGIGFQFMEISKAHFIWKTILVSILIIFVTFIGVAYTV
ncbi:MAG: hypothetical protein GY936_08645 [Ignavibacteriae bacterium]|nr:hypothetical protein [Ignavibacteriota bacterium]